VKVVLTGTGNSRRIPAGYVETLDMVERQLRELEGDPPALRVGLRAVKIPTFVGAHDRCYASMVDVISNGGA
jgi:hypothetical protein